MLNYFFLWFFFFSFFNFSFAKDISLEVLANPNNVSTEMSEEKLLTLNGYRQAITGELLELKLDSELFWSKLDQKNSSLKAMDKVIDKSIDKAIVKKTDKESGTVSEKIVDKASDKESDTASAKTSDKTADKISIQDEMIFLQSFFQNVSLTRPAPIESKIATAPEITKLSGNFKATLDVEKLKTSFFELTTDLAEIKLKSFYLQTSIDLDSKTTWDDVGVQKSESFTGVIFNSWKKLLEKEIKGFERFSSLEKDPGHWPDSMNSKSVTLKWTSTLKKVSTNNTANNFASYEVSAHYVLQNTKSGLILSAFDFPIQKRDLETQNKKALSSSLASLVYNLLFSKVQKINSIIEANAKNEELAEFEIKIISKSSLTEIHQLNSFLEEKFKDLKLTSQMKSYSSESSVLSIRAEGNSDKILEILSRDLAKIPLNEQKILLFNRIDKTFAILPKDLNNKN